MKLVTALFFIMILLVSCQIQDDIILWAGGDLIYTRDIHDPEIFLLGQSNASPELAIAIESATNKATAQINHSGNSIEAWLSPKWFWVQTDKDFINNRSFDYLIWFQGEANIYSLYNYENNFISVLDYVYPYNHNIEIIIIQVHMENPELDLSGIRSIQSEMVKKHSNWHLIDSEGLDRVDGTHLSESGMKALSASIKNMISTIEVE
jgi:hypothetical protein